MCDSSTRAHKVPWHTAGEGGLHYASLCDHQPVSRPDADVAIWLGLLQFHIVTSLEHQDLKEPAAGIRFRLPFHQAIQADAASDLCCPALQSPLLLPNCS